MAKFGEFNIPQERMSVADAKAAYPDNHAPWGLYNAPGLRRQFDSQQPPGGGAGGAPGGMPGVLPDGPPEPRFDMTPRRQNIRYRSQGGGF